MAISSITIKQLRFFVHVVDAGSITRAAKELNVAQTALGLQVRKLEDVLDVALLTRRSSGISPTRAGRLICERARQIVQSIDLLLDDARAFTGGEARDVHIGMVPSLMRGVGAPAVLRERTALPGLNLHLVEGTRKTLVQGLAAGEFDFIFAHDLSTEGTLRAVPVLRQPLGLVVASSAGVAAHAVSFAEALKTDIVVRGETSHTVDVLTQTAADLGLRPNFAFEIDSLAAMTQVIRDFGATAITTTDLVADEVARGDLTVHSIIDPPVDLTLEFGMRSSEPPGPAEIDLFRFLDALIDDFCSQVGGEDRRLARLATLVEPEFESTGD
jgi:LysR family nitrogen assimilation transcriptional regulator